MSDDDSSASSSEGEDVTLTGLVATRARRQTAGNLYATLRDNLDDEELQKELLAEDEAEDAEDYQGSEREDDDAAMESSSSEDEGAKDDEMEGEKELRKAERKDQLKRKRERDAKMKVPGVFADAGPAKKRVKLADEATVDGEEGAGEKAKKRKKSERSNWLPDAADLPTRQSRRSLAVASRETTHANLKESAMRSEKQRKVMEKALKKEPANVRMELTQEERLEKCQRIEKETAKELGRFEREEAERMRLREEALAAKRRRGLEGAVIRWWSGSGVYEDGKLQVKRMEGKTLGQYVEEVKRKEEEARRREAERAEAARKEAERLEAERIEAAKREVERLEQERVEAERAEAARLEAEQAAMDFVNWSGDGSRPTTAVGEPYRNVMGEAPQEAGSSTTAPADISWLSGIHEYAADTDSAQSALPNAYTPSAPLLNASSELHAPPRVSQPLAPATTTPAELQALPLPRAPPVPPAQQSTYPAWPPGSTSTFSATATLPANPPPPYLPANPTPPSLPILREQAQRTLLTLESFPSLAPPPPTTSKPARKALSTTTTNPLNPTDLSAILLPESHPPFSAQESLYLAPPKPTKTKKTSTQSPSLPDAPSKPRCAVTGWPAKYRDPKTGLPYADLQVYKILKRVLDGGCQWSGVLGAWVGPSYGKMGRPAKGCPEGFASAGTGTVVKKEEGVRRAVGELS